MMNILKKTLVWAAALYSILVGLTIVFAWTSSAIALEIDNSLLTVPLNESGEQTTLTVDELMLGQRKFNSSCAQCHIDGSTKPNPDVDLTRRTLALATPARNSVTSLLDYLDNPTTYDGLRSLSELHPSTLNLDLFPRMQGLTRDDLKAIAGYVLAEPNIVGEQWGGGKPRR